MSPTLRSHAGFAAFVLVSAAVFYPFLRQLISLSLDDGRYSHIILVPVISAFVLYLGRRRIFSGARFCPKTRAADGGGCAGGVCPPGSGPGVQALAGHAGDCAGLGGRIRAVLRSACLAVRLCSRSDCCC